MSKQLLSPDVAAGGALAGLVIGMMAGVMLPGALIGAVAASAIGAGVQAFLRRKPEGAREEEEGTAAGSASKQRDP